MVVVLAACGGLQPPIGAPRAMQQNAGIATRERSVAAKFNGAHFGVKHTTAESTLYAFMGGNDGEGPNGLVADGAGAFYGTTVAGGPAYCANHFYTGCGTVFKLAPSGSSYHESIWWWFSNQTGAGAYPNGSLIDVNGVLYGTTAFGGIGSFLSGYGTVFDVTAQYIENTLYQFTGGSDGYAVTGGVTADSAGALYGTTAGGGTYRLGNVYRLTPISGGYTNTVLYSFTGGNDGQYPNGDVIDVNGTLFGTTCGQTIASTVYKLTPSGSGYKESTLHTFGGKGDGECPPPNSGVISVKGVLYGTTYYGGGACNCGTAYKLTPAGSGYKERVLYKFTGGSDGAYPNSGVIEVKGNLYGTASGGAYGYGMVFELKRIRAGYRERVVYSFTDGSDGAYPSSGVIDVNGSLYGTAVGGGTYGYGTVFRLTP